MSAAWGPATWKLRSGGPADSGGGADAMAYVPARTVVPRSTSAAAALASAVLVAPDTRTTVVWLSHGDRAVTSIPSSAFATLPFGAVQPSGADLQPAAASTRWAAGRWSSRPTSTTPAPCVSGAASCDGVMTLSRTLWVATRRPSSAKIRRAALVSAMSGGDGRATPSVGAAALDASVASSDHG